VPHDAGEIVDDEPRNEPRDVPRNPDARRGDPMHPVAQHSRGRATAARRQVLTTHGEVDVEPVRPGDE
jgi:hypothetical protein